MSRRPLSRLFPDQARRSTPTPPTACADLRAREPTPRVAPAVGALMALCALAAPGSAWSAGLAARAAPVERLLPPAAFREVTPCAPIDPFADATADPRPRRTECGTEAPWRLSVRTPRLRPVDPGPGRIELDLDRQVGLRRGAFTGLARLDVRADSPNGPQGLQARRTLLAAQGRLQLAERLSLSLGVGRDLLPEGRSRAVASATWQAPGRHVMVMQLAAEPERGLASSLGLRWWLAPGRLALDLGATREADAPSLAPRIALRMNAG